jgi:hypothetical protein
MGITRQMEGRKPYLTVSQHTLALEKLLASNQPSQGILFAIKQGKLQFSKLG